MNKTYAKLVAECLPYVQEIFPWDLQEWLETGRVPLLLDVREPYEFEALHIEGSINVPRGILEAACEFGYEETVPELASARDQEIVLLCRSGNRSVLAAMTLAQLGYRNVYSLKTGLRGWNEYEQPLVDALGRSIDINDAEDYFTPRLRPEQLPQTPRRCAG